METEFTREDIEYWIPEIGFKGLTKQYIVNACFNESIQKSWKPKVGDVIVGCTGNIFVISGSHNLIPELGGPLYFFGGGLCNRNGGNFLDQTYCYTMNEKGIIYDSSRRPVQDVYHSKVSSFRYVPYPHEL